MVIVYDMQSGRIDCGSASGEDTAHQEAHPCCEALPRLQERSDTRRTPLLLPPPLVVCNAARFVDEMAEEPSFPPPR